MLSFGKIELFMTNPHSQEIGNDENEYRRAYHRYQYATEKTEGIMF